MMDLKDWVALRQDQHDRIDALQAALNKSGIHPSARDAIHWWIDAARDACGDDTFGKCERLIGLAAKKLEDELAWEEQKKKR
jgi:hypothetical protein